MKVGFFLVDTGTLDGALWATYAAALVRSVRVSMPGVQVYQFTDETTDAVDGVDEVFRKPAEPMAVLRMRHHASLEGEWLFVDADVIIQKDVRKVFAGAFDVAITTRNWSHLKASVGFAERMPFNVGVMFSRNRSFWKRALESVLEMSSDLQQWMGDQHAICDLVATHHMFRVAFLKGTKYNLPPSFKPPNAEMARLLSKACIVHYKGTERKAMLLNRIRDEEALCASAS